MALGTSPAVTREGPAVQKMTPSTTVSVLHRQWKPLGTQETSPLTHKITVKKTNWGSQLPGISILAIMLVIIGA